MSKSAISKKIVFIGDSTVGKTSILRRYIDKTFEETLISTIGVDYFNKKLKYGDKDVMINYWDTAGQEKYSTITRQYLRDIDGIAFVFDLTSKKSFESVTNWFHKLKDFTSLDNVQSVLIGNKCDEPDKQQVTEQKIDWLKKYLGSSAYFSVSAKANVNITKCMSYLEKIMIKANEGKNFNESKIFYVSRQPKKKEKRVC